MERGSFFRTSNGVVDCDNDLVSPVGFNGGGWKLAVDEYYVFLIAIWCYGTSCDREVIGSLLA